MSKVNTALPTFNHDCILILIQVFYSFQIINRMASIIELNSRQPTTNAIRNITNNLESWKVFAQEFTTTLRQRTVSQVIIESNPQRNSVVFIFEMMVINQCSAILSCQVNLLTKSWSISAKMVLGESLNCLRSCEMSKNLCKLTVLINLLSNKYHFEVFVHSLNGQLKFKRPSIFQDYTHVGAISRIIQAITDTKRFMENFNAFMLLNLNIIPLQTFLESAPEFLKRLYVEDMGEPKMMQRVKGLLALTDKDITVRNKQSAKPINKTKLTQDVKQTKKQFQYGRQSLRSKELYTFFDEKQVQKLHNGGLDITTIEKELTFPVLDVTENCMIVNQIEIVSFGEDRKKVIYKGGKAELAILPVKIKNVFLDNPKESKQTSNQEVRNKMMVVKIPPKGKEQTKSAHVIYQKDILSNFRGKSCVYLNRYYETDTPTFPYRNCLMMDFISGFTLHEEVETKKIIISQTSKMRMLTHISNALRFMEQQQVSHIDLSPNNLMVVSDLMVKIIDFGEAYSPNTTPKYLGGAKKPFTYRPGRTIPFSAPEVYTRSNDLTSRQDIFSLGIIAFKMFFGSYPMSCSQSLLERVYTNRTYMEQIYFVPEKLNDLGNPDVLLLIGAVIFKCLDVDESMRPSPTWVHLILKRLLASQRI